MSEYHIVMTAAVDGGGYVSANVTVIPRPGSTRQSLFNDLLTKMARDTGISPRALTPLFFTLEPNQLDTATI